MGYNFPSAPVYGEVYEDYAWDGEKWLCGKLSAPDWVPEGALVHIEFYDGVARAWDGTGLLDGVGIGALLGNDPNAANWSGGSEYSPDGVTANGYDYNNFAGSYYGPAALGVLKALLPNALTYVVTCNFDEWYAEMYMALLPEGADQSNVEIWSSVGGNILAYTDSGVGLELPGAYNTEPGIFKQNRIAFTHKPPLDGNDGLLAISANGGDVQQAALTGADFLGGLNTTWYIDNIPLHAITIYAEQPVEALPVLSNLHLAPEIRAITPRDVEMGGAAFELTVEGFSFDEGAIVLVDGVDQPTVYVSANVLTATLQGSATATVVKISVRGGDDRMSNEHDVEFYDPVAGPVWANGASVFIDLIKPGRVWTGTEVLDADKATGIGLFLGHDATTNAYVGGSYTTYDQRVVQVEGYNASWLNGTNRIPAYLVPLKETLLYPGATLQVTTRTTAGWWVKRPKLVFTASDAANYITVQQAAAAYTITARGGTLNLTAADCFVEPQGESYEEYIRNRFALTLAGTRLEFAANGIAGSLVSATLTDADRPAANPLTGICEEGYNIESIAIYPLLPTTDGLVDLSALVAVPPPVAVAPTLTSITPSSVKAGTAEFTLTLTGTDFTPDCIVYTAGAVPEPTTFVNATTLTALVQPIANAGSLTVKVTNSLGTSNVLSITFTPGVPTLTSIAPSTAVGGGANEIEVVLFGTNFTTDCIVLTAGAVPEPTTYISSGGLSALINPLAGAGSLSVKVSNSVTGDQSNALTLMFTDPPVPVAAPDWVPPNAIGYVDFMEAPQGRGWDGFGVYDAVSLEAMLGSDPHSNIYNWESYYDPAGIIATGYDYYTAGLYYGPAALGHFKARAIDPLGVTAVLRFNISDDFYIYSALNSSRTSVIEIHTTNFGDLHVYMPSSGSPVFNLGKVILNNSGENCIAWTVTPTLVEISVNGDRVWTNPLTAADWPDGPPIGFNVDATAIMNIALYPPQDAATLQELSTVAAPVVGDPPPPDIVIDFLTNTATSGGAAVGIETLVGTDPVAEADAWASAYDPVLGLSATGYATGPVNKLLCFIGAAKALMTSGATVVVNLLNEEGTGNPTWGFYSPAYGQHLETVQWTADTTVEVWADSPPSFRQASADGYISAAVGDINRIASQIVHSGFNSQIFASANGQEQFGNGAAVHATSWELGYTGLDTGTKRIQSIEIYNNAGVTPAMLPALSTKAPPTTGGGEAPAWVPAGALVHVDFLNGGRAWDGTTELDTAGIGTLFGSEPTQDAWTMRVSTFNPLWITETGYKPPSTQCLAFLGAAKAALFAGASLVLRWRHDVTVNASKPECYLYSADGAKAIRFHNPGATWDMYAGNSTYGSDGAVDRSATLMPGAGGFTVTGTGGTDIHFSANNAPQMTVLCAEADIPAATPLTNGMITAGYITSVTIYPPAADLAPLTTPDPAADPAVLPEPLIHIDFLNDTATNAGATVGIMSLLGSDSVAQSGDGVSNLYNPALNLNPNGYCTDGYHCGYIGAAKVALTNGATLVYRCRTDWAAPFPTITHGHYGRESTGKNLEAILDHVATLMSVTADEGVLYTASSDPGTVVGAVVGDINTFAVQITHQMGSMESEIYASVNGGPVFGGVVPTSADGWNFSYELFDSGKNRIQTIDIYENGRTLPAMLPALSGGGAARSSQKRMQRKRARVIRAARKARRKPTRRGEK